jgi:hypothetical protein
MFQQIGTGEIEYEEGNNEEQLSIGEDDYSQEIEQPLFREEQQEQASAIVDDRPVEAGTETTTE